MNIIAKYFYRFIGLKINTDGSSDFQGKQPLHLNNLDTGWLKFLIYDLFFKVFVHAGFIPMYLFVSHRINLSIASSIIFLSAVCLRYSVRNEIEKMLAKGQPLRPDYNSYFFGRIYVPTGLIYNIKGYSIKKSWLCIKVKTPKNPEKISEDSYVRGMESFVDLQVCGIITAFVFLALTTLVGRKFFIGDTFFNYSLLVFFLIALPNLIITIRAIHQNIFEAEGL